MGNRRKICQARLKAVLDKVERQEITLKEAAKELCIGRPSFLPAGDARSDSFLEITFFCRQNPALVFD